MECQEALLPLVNLKVNHLQEVSLAVKHKLLHKRAHFLVEPKLASKEINRVLTALNLNQRLAAWAKLKTNNLSQASSSKVSRVLGFQVALDSNNNLNKLRAVFLDSHLLAKLVCSNLNRCNRMPLK